MVSLSKTKEYPFFIASMSLFCIVSKPAIYNILSTPESIKLDVGIERADRDLAWALA